MGIWNKIFGGGAKDVIDNVGNLVDRYYRTLESRYE